MTTRKAMQDDSWFEPLSQMEWFRPLTTFNQLLTRAMSIYIGEIGLFLGIAFYVVAAEQMFHILFVDEELLEEGFKRVQNGQNSEEIGEWVLENPRAWTTMCHAYLFMAFRGVFLGAANIAVAGIYCRQRPNAQYCLKKALSKVGSLFAFHCPALGLLGLLGLFSQPVALFLAFTTSVIVIEGQDLISSLNRSRKVIMHSMFSTIFHVIVIWTIFFVAFSMTTAVGKNHFGKDFSLKFNFSIRLFFDSMAETAMAVVYLNMRTKYEGLTEAGLCRELGIDMPEEEDHSISNKVDITDVQETVTCSGLNDVNILYNDNIVTKAMEGKANKLD